MNRNFGRKKIQLLFFLFFLGIFTLETENPPNGGNQSQSRKVVQNNKNVKEEPSMTQKKEGSSGDRDPPPLKPYPNSMTLKPKTPYSLPKSAMAKLDDKVMRTKR